VNIDEKVWNCHHCGFTGKLVEKTKKVYFKPPETKLPLSPKAHEWLKKRGFSDYTIQRFKIGESVEFMPQVGKERNCLNLKYYRNGELINIKFRDGNKNFKMVKNAELILFNLDGIDGEEEIIISEGEFDCMAFYEAGITSVCSVPNGASKGNGRLEYLDNCYDAFRNAKKIILATDGDEPGKALRDQLARRLGRYRCSYIEYPEGYKDSNEVLLKFGKDGVKRLIEGAKEFPVEGIYKVSDLEQDLDYVFEHGFDAGVKIGYPEFDQIFSFRKGELTVITGIPGSGKSAFLDQCLIKLSAKHGWKHGICSFENQPTTMHIGKLASCFVGRPFLRKNNDEKMSEVEWAYAKYFIDEHFYFFAIQDIDTTVDGILEKAKELVMRYGIDSLVIDPWNYVEFNLDGMTETQFVSMMLSKISLFAKEYNVHIFLIAHPVKIPKNNGRFEVPTLYSISGSAHFFNKTDNGITVYRDFETNDIMVYVQKVRFFFVGKIGSALFQYEVSTGRYAPQGECFENDMQIFYDRIDMWDEVKNSAQKYDRGNYVDYSEPKAF